MAQHRNSLPQLSGRLFLTDGGIETSLIFHDGFDLPCFAAYDLLRHEAGIEALRRYYRRYAEIARSNEVGFILESATWRANPDWGLRMGHSADELAILNRRAIQLMSEVRSAFQTDATPIVISGCIGPRGDGYAPGRTMTPAEAEAYHAAQIGTFSETDADMVTALTMTYAGEAIGVTRAAQKVGMPVVISFTVETDGRLPTGQSLGDTIAEVDDATGRGPVYYMINCAHPTHFEAVLASDDGWIGRLRGVRANASRRSHAELDEAIQLDDGEPVELGMQYGELRRRFPTLNVFGGCCGTDHRHIEQICLFCKSFAAEPA